MTDTTKLSDSTRADLQKRVDAAFKASSEAAARGEIAAADAHWKHLIGLLEVQMGRSSSAEKLTMTPSPRSSYDEPSHGVWTNGKLERGSPVAER